MPHRHCQATQRSIRHQASALLQCADHLGSKLSTHPVKGGINALPCRHPAGGTACCQTLLGWLCSVESRYELQSQVQGSSVLLLSMDRRLQTGIAESAEPCLKGWQGTTHCLTICDVLDPLHQILLVCCNDSIGPAQVKGRRLTSLPVQVFSGGSDPHTAALWQPSTQLAQVGACDCVSLHRL